ncbi:hypothetical protein Tco_0729413 [Tanacetum coccineum]|uniref:Integrase, catalytic region, zinc finger, CCHC-type, peptidase aspartic, catalytic n=1 Tax=Tanacetum coccineum TaxID=301880 RepID=A0ABQ4YPQ9_9ASTR
MSNQSEDIQAASSDTRPPMLDKTDFESWQQRIRLYCTDGPYLGPERDKVVVDLSQAEKDRLRADIRATNILLQGFPRDIYKLINHNTDAKDIWDNVKMLLEGSELTKDDRESQLYDEFKHFGQHKGENIHDYYVRFTKLINDMRHIKIIMPKIQLNSKFVNNMLPEWGRFVTAVKLNRGLKESNHDQSYVYLKQHESHANENKMLMERLNQHSHDPLDLVYNVSPYQYPSSSSVPPQPLYTPPVTYQPQFTDNTQLDTGFSLVDELLENLTKQGRQNRVQGNNAGGIAVAGNRGLENGVDLDEEQLLFLAGGQTNTFDDEVDEGPVQDMDQNEDNIFQVDQCDAFDSDVDGAPTAQTMFMANLSSADPVYDEAGLSYDSDTLFEVQDHNNCLDNMNESHEEHEIHNDVQPNDVVNSDTEYTSNSNIISYEQYVQDNEDQVVHSNVSYVPNDAVMIITNDIYEQDAPCVTSNNTFNASLTAELARYKELAEMRMIIKDCNVKEESLQKELHSVKMQLNSTLNHNKLIQEEHDKKITAEKGGKKKADVKADQSKKPTTAKKPKPLPSKQSKPAPATKPKHEPQPQGEGEEFDLNRAIQMSLETFQAHGQAPVGGVTICEQVEEATRPLHAVEGKGKAIATDEQAVQSLLALHTPKRRSTIDQFIFQRRTPTTKEASTGPSAQPQDDASANIVRDSPSPADAETKANTNNTTSTANTEVLYVEDVQGEKILHTVVLEEKTVKLDEGQAGSDPGKTPESRPPPKHEHMDEDQAGPNPGQSHEALAGLNPEPMDDDFNATVYPKVHESLKHTTEEHVYLENPLSSSVTLSSMKNLDDAFTFDDQFLNDKPTEEEPGKTTMEIEVESMVTVPIHQASTSVPPLSKPIIDLSPPKPVSSPL